VHAANGRPAGSAGFAREDASVRDRPGTAVPGVATLDRELAGCASLAELRAVRRRWTKALTDASAGDVLRLAGSVEPRFIGYELVLHHAAALAAVDRPIAVRLAGPLTNWGEVDAFGSLLAGPAWLHGRLTDDDVVGWARSTDRWWRRAALVATTVLNTRSRGGHGDSRRTVLVCDEVVDDRDDMVVKGLSWALRSLTWHDPHAVRGFLQDHGPRVAARVRREVDNKLTTGLKSPRR
jgi:3-methyladenine DNA glycosylase AlkD